MTEPAPKTPDPAALLNDVEAIAHEAGEAIMAFYNGAVEAEIINKADGSPVSNADLEVDARYTDRVRRARCPRG